MAEKIDGESKKALGPFTAMGVKHAPPGRHRDGKGLYLLVSPGGARSWVLRVQSEGKRRDIGLGAADTGDRPQRPPEPIAIPLLQRKLLTLSEAREKARLLREAAKAGLDPIAERDRERRPFRPFAKRLSPRTQRLRKGGRRREPRIS